MAIQVNQNERGFRLQLKQTNEDDEDYIFPLYQIELLLSPKDLLPVDGGSQPGTPSPGSAQ